MKARLGSLCDFVNGGTPSKTVDRYFTGAIPWITSADLVGPVADRARSLITHEAIDASATNLVPKGTVLLVTRTGVGKVAVAGFDLCFSQDITALLHDSKRLDRGFLVHFLRTKQPHFDRLARGATIKGITRDVVSDLEIDLPPLHEQRRIAVILDQADALRAKRREALAQLDRLTQAIFVEMFGDANANSWPVTTIGEVARGMRTGPFGSQLLHSEFVDDGVAVLGIDNVVANEFRWADRRFINEAKYRSLKRYTVYPGDVLITIMGTCGRCAVVPDSIPLAINTKHLCCITLDRTKCLPEFLHSYFLRHSSAQRYLEQKAKGAIMAGLNMGIIKEMPLPLPPISLQRKFVAQETSIRALRVTCGASLRKFDSLFGALQHRAFRGEL